MDYTWMRRLSLALVPIGVAIAVLGFAFLDLIDGIFGIGLIAAGVGIYLLVPDTGDPTEMGEPSTLVNRLAILAICLVGGLVSVAYVMFF